MLFIRVCGQHMIVSQVILMYGDINCTTTVWQGAKIRINYILFTCMIEAFCAHVAKKHANKLLSCFFLVISFSLYKLFPKRYIVFKLNAYRHILFSFIYTLSTVFSLKTFLRVNWASFVSQIKLSTCYSPCGLRVHLII